MNQLSVTSFSPKTGFPSLCASVPSLSSPLHPLLHRTLSPIGKELSPVAERTPTFLPHPLTRSKPSFAALLKRTCWFLTNIKNLIRIVTRIRMCRGRKKLGHAQAFYTLFQTFPPVGSWNWRIYFHRSLFFFFSSALLVARYKTTFHCCTWILFEGKVDSSALLAMEKTTFQTQERAKLQGIKLLSPEGSELTSWAM